LVAESGAARVAYRVERLLGAGSSSHTYLCVIEAAGDGQAGEADAEAGRGAVGERVALKAVRACTGNRRRRGERCVHCYN
jgi:hypothetical protein